MTHEDLWRDFPKTLPEFERRFPDEESCRAYLIEVRWGGRPRCDRCQCDRVWQSGRGLWECSACGHQTSITSGTPLHRTRKPLKLWFRAIWEMVTRKTGISGKDLQRLMGITAEPVFAVLNQWPESMPQYTVGHTARIAELEARIAQIPGLHIAGNAYHGIGLPDCVRSGKQAADAIMRSRL